MPGASVCPVAWSCRGLPFSESPIVARLAADRCSRGALDGAVPDSHPGGSRIPRWSPYLRRWPLDWRERAPTQASGSCVSIPCPPESGPSASDLRGPDDRIVSSKRDVRVFRKGNFPSSRFLLIYLDVSCLDPFTTVLPQTTLDPPLLVTRVVRLALPLRETRRRARRLMPERLCWTEDCNLTDADARPLRSGRQAKRVIALVGAKQKRRLPPTVTLRHAYKDPP